MLVFSSNLTADLCPFDDAVETSVHPSPSFKLTSTLPISRSILTTASCPFHAALDVT
jgi:hypothetical protein